MIPKEIQDKISEAIELYNNPNATKAICEIISEQLATDGREELEKELEGYRDFVKIILEYGDYFGSVALSEEDGIYYGRILEIHDLVSYEGGTLTKVIKAFKEAVNEYEADKQNKQNPFGG